MSFTWQHGEPATQPIRTARPPAPAGAPRLPGWWTVGNPRTATLGAIRTALAGAGTSALVLTLVDAL